MSAPSVARSGFWRRAARASVRTRLEYLHVAALALVVEAALRVVRLERLAAALGVTVGNEGDAPADDTTPDAELPQWAHRRLAIVHSVMRRWPVDGTCLRESLLAGNRLRMLRPHLRIGVRTDGADVSAHAWLEVDGRSLDRGASSYAALL